MHARGMCYQFVCLQEGLRNWQDCCTTGDIEHMGLSYSPCTEVMERLHDQDKARTVHSQLLVPTDLAVPCATVLFPVVRRGRAMIGAYPAVGSHYLRNHQFWRRADVGHLYGHSVVPVPVSSQGSCCCLALAPSLAEACRCEPNRRP